ncbi:MAG: hypothetical protein K0R00_225 [Herbinix sp.]|jgi:hypothetical protein|nr:hypothetical protein [Herbinix sp.]
MPMLLFGKKESVCAPTPKYRTEISKLVDERKAVQNVMRFICDPDLYNVYQDKLQNIDAELGLLYKKARTENERNDQLYVVTSTIKQYQKNLYQ